MTVAAVFVFVFKLSQDVSVAFNPQTLPGV